MCPQPRTKLDLPSSWLGIKRRLELTGMPVSHILPALNHSAKKVKKKSPPSPRFGSPQTCKIWGAKNGPQFGASALVFNYRAPIWGSILAPLFRARGAPDPTEMLLKTVPSESNNFRLVACDLMTQHPNIQELQGMLLGT